MATHLIIAEHDGQNVKGATLSALTAAKNIEGTCHGLVMGSNCAQVAEAFSAYVSKIHLADSPDLEHRLAQTYAAVVADVAEQIGADYVWMAATEAGKGLLPRVAVRLKAAMASDIMAVKGDDTFERPMWAGDLIGTVQLKTPKKVISVRPTEFPHAESVGTGEVQKVEVKPVESKMRYVSFDSVKSERPELTEAKVVISGGRGLKGPEGFKDLIEPLADKLGAAIGASRAVCDAGWVPNDWQVGQTGKVVAPDLYFAIGISGAIQHVAGMKGSKVVVAINKDPEAPIFQVADYGLVADLFKAVPELDGLL